MKSKTIVTLIVSIFSTLCVAQNSVRLYSGVNMASLNEVRWNASQFIEPRILPLPYLGFDFRVPIKKRFTISSGIGVQMLGTKDYVDVEDPGPLDRNLRITYLSFPVKLERILFNNLSLYGGFSINYSVRKNQIFYLVDHGPDFLYLVNIYKNWVTMTMAGLSFELGDVQLSVGYQHTINRIYDTDHHEFPDFRAFGNLRSWQISVGYIIREDNGDAMNRRTRISSRNRNR